MRNVPDVVKPDSLQEGWIGCPTSAATHCRRIRRKTSSFCFVLCALEFTCLGGVFRAYERLEAYLVLDTWDKNVVNDKSSLNTLFHTL